MPILNVKANVTAPAEINIPLVRADQLHTNNVFRIVFEVCLAVFASLIGVMLSIDEPTRLHWVFVVFTGVLGGAFLLLSIRALKEP